MKNIFRILPFPSICSHLDFLWFGITDQYHDKESVVIWPEPELLNVSYLLNCQMNWVENASEKIDSNVTIHSLRPRVRIYFKIIYNAYRIYMKQNELVACMKLNSILNLFNLRSSFASSWAACSQRDCSWIQPIVAETKKYIDVQVSIEKCGQELNNVFIDWLHRIRDNYLMQRWNPKMG